VDNLRAFASAVESLEEELAGRTAHLAWGPPPGSGPPGDPPAGPREPYPGGTLPRAALAALAPPLQRRALWRLLSEGTGLPPSRALLAILEDDLLHQRATRRTLPGGWTLELAPEQLVLSPPGLGAPRPGPGSVEPETAAPDPARDAHPRRAPGRAPG
jgi:hypothetical protein